MSRWASGSQEQRTGVFRGGECCWWWTVLQVLSDDIGALLSGESEETEDDGIPGTPGMARR
jgi:hypothetical protein